ncbi:MAG: hypothetical protein ACYDGR_04980 [Candidatus Dormibacteria bacterium]
MNAILKELAEFLDECVGAVPLFDLQDVTEIFLYRLPTTQPALQLR